MYALFGRVLYRVVNLEIIPYSNKIGPPPPHWMIYEVVRPERSGELAQSIEFLKINQKFEAILGRRKMAWKNDKSKN